MDKLIDALRETLSKLGLDEEKIEAAIQEAVAKASAEGDPNPSGDPVPPEPNSDPVPPVDPVDGKEGEGGEPTSDSSNPDDVPPAEGDPVPPAEDSTPPVEPDVVPVAGQSVPEVPPFDPAPLLAEIDELKKANKGLLARVDSLTEALKTAGVIDDSNPVAEVGDPLPAAAPSSPTDDVMSSVLNKLNGNQKF